MARAVKRTYRRDHRLESGRLQVAATKTLIMQSARRLFSQEGFHSTTIASIALEAGVSEPTVYLHFASKLGILQALADAVALEFGQLELYKRYSKAQDSMDQLRVGLKALRRYMEAAADIERAVRGAGDSKAEAVVVTGFEDAARQRHAARVVASLQRDGKLLPGMSRREAVDVLHLLSSLEVYEILVGGLGWDADAYEGWLVKVASTLLTGTPPEPVLTDR